MTLKLRKYKQNTLEVIMTHLISSVIWTWKAADALRSDLMECYEDNLWESLK